MALIALAVSAFAIGTTEFISVGSAVDCGGYEYIRHDRRINRLDVCAWCYLRCADPYVADIKDVQEDFVALDYDHFIIGNSLAAGASSIGIPLAARVFSAFSHGVFMSIGSIIAASVVPENRRASAISIMFTGLTVATVTGVPLGTFIGQQWGWRLAFVAIVVVGIVALIANSILVPSDLPKGERTSFREQAKLLTNGRLPLCS